MENHCISICKCHLENPEGSYSDDNQAGHRQYPSYADDAQYFDIDISLPFSRTETTPTSSEENHSEDELEFNFSICTTNPPNPTHSFSPADNWFYKGQLLPLQLIPTPLDHDIDIKDIIAIPARAKTHFPKLLKTATKLKISWFGFRKSAKHAMDLQSPCAAYEGTGIGMGSHVLKQNRFFTVKCKVEEVPLVSLLTKDNSMSAKRHDDNHGFQKNSEAFDDGEGQTCKNMDRNKKKAKEIVQKYVKKIKPLCVKTSQRSNDKSRLRDAEKPGVRNGVKNGRCQGSERSDKQMSFSDFCGNLKMVYKHLGKGKQQPSDMQQQLPNYYRCDSTLMEVQSVIQEAIAHCKQSNYIH